MPKKCNHWARQLAKPSAEGHSSQSAQSESDGRTELRRRLRREQEEAEYAAKGRCESAVPLLSSVTLARVLVQFGSEFAWAYLHDHHKLAC